MRTAPLRTVATLIATLALVAPVAAGTVAAAIEPAPASTLVADAGDSAYLNAGRPASFLGTAFGGVEPYSFAWTGGGDVQDRANPTAVVFTDGDDPTATHTLTLTVTDATGATASDTVLYQVQAPLEGAVIDLADFERMDTEATPPNPNYLQDPNPLLFPFEVTESYERLDIDIAFGEHNDYDAQLVNPDGQSVSQSGEGATSLVLGSESLSASAPGLGTWTVELHRFATVPGDTITVDVDATLLPDAATDPRPSVDSDGPFTFVDGAPQDLTATVAGPSGTTVAWDLDFDGTFETAGEDVTASLPRGRHLVSVKATTPNGFERRETTSVLVGTTDQVRHDTVPFTVIGMSDSGINPYHSEFSAATYPDPEVLEATKNFTLHPCEYLTLYPCSAKPLPVSHGDYHPANDTWMWNGNDWVEPSQLYWVPGTKIIGAIDSGGSTGANAGADPLPILDDNGHGTGSASVSAGNRYGYCPTCLIFMVEALDESVVVNQPWVDITSHSHGYQYGLPIGHLAKALQIMFGGGIGDTQAAVERGVNVLFAAGNGIGNAFDVPQRTYDSDQTGPEWNITVGALRRDNQGAIIGDGIPAHLSSWGDGNLPSACRTGVTGQCAFGGTSAATPYTAGTFGTVLSRVRDLLGDGKNAPREIGGQGQVIAAGNPVPGSPFLEDGMLTREELRQVMLKTAEALNTTGEQNRYVYTGTYTAEEQRHAFEGYGAATPNAADRATAVLFGLEALPDRSDADGFFEDDCEFRTTYYGEFDRTGDGVIDEADSCGALFADARFNGDGDRTTDSPFADFWAPARADVAESPVVATPLTYYLHRTLENGPGGAPSCSEKNNEMFISMANEAGDGDIEGCFDSRLTSQAAAFRPKGIFTAADVLTGTLAPGSNVDVTAFFQTSADAPALAQAGVDSSNATQTPLVGTFGAVLVAGDREIGRSPEVEVTTGPTGWTQIDLDFATVLPAYVGEHLTIYFHHLGFPGYGYGYDGDHASTFTVTPAALADTPADFGVTIDAPSNDVRPSGGFTLSGQVAFPDRGADPKLAGFHPNVDLVQVSVGDDTFADPAYAVVDPFAGTYTIDVAGLGSADTVFVRALRDRTPSPTASITFPTGNGGTDGTDGGTDGGSAGTDGGTDGTHVPCEKADKYRAKADKYRDEDPEKAAKYDAKADEAQAECDASGGCEKAAEYRAKADKYRDEDPEKAAKYDAKADEAQADCDAEDGCEKADYYRAKADKYRDEDPEKAAKYDAKADEAQAECDGDAEHASALPGNASSLALLLALAFLAWFLVKPVARD